MSGSMYCRPYDVNWELLPEDLYFHSGVRNYISKKNYVNKDDLLYFQALKDSKIEGADKIIEMIEKFGEVEIKIKY